MVWPGKPTYNMTLVSPPRLPARLLAAATALLMFLAGAQALAKPKKKVIKKPPPKAAKAPPKIPGSVESVPPPPVPAAAPARPGRPAQAEPPAPKGAPGPGAVVQRESKIEFDERLVQGQSAAGAIYLFQRGESEFLSMVDVPRSFKERTIEKVFQGRPRPTRK